MIFNVPCKQRKQISQEQDNLQVSMKREMKAARTVAIVVGLCLASFVPLLVILCLRFVTSTIISSEHMYGAYLLYVSMSFLRESEEEETKKRRRTEMSSSA